MRTQERVKNSWQDQGMRELYWDNPSRALDSPVNRHIKPIVERMARENKARGITRLCELIDRENEAERSGDIAAIASAYLYRQLLESRGF